MRAERISEKAAARSTVAIRVLFYHTDLVALQHSKQSLFLRRKRTMANRPVFFFLREIQNDVEPPLSGFDLISYPDLTLSLGIQ